MYRLRIILLKIGSYTAQNEREFLLTYIPTDHSAEEQRAGGKCQKAFYPRRQGTRSRPRRVNFASTVPGHPHPKRLGKQHRAEREGPPRTADVSPSAASTAHLAARGLVPGLLLAGAGAPCTHPKEHYSFIHKFPGPRISRTSEMCGFFWRGCGLV